MYFNIFRSIKMYLHVQYFNISLLRCIYGMYVGFMMPVVFRFTVLSIVISVLFTFLIQ